MFLFRLLATLALTGGCYAATAVRPNILFICVDDLKPLLGCYGSPLIKSPNIDRLAARGLRFDLAFTNQAVCAPSRNSLLTGLRPTTLGIYDLPTFFRYAIPDIVTLPQYFLQRGWRTEALGKIYHVGHGNITDVASWSVPHWNPRTDGQYALPASIAQIRTTADGSYGPAVESAEVPDTRYADGLIADEAINRLRAASQSPDTPFFLAVGFLKPHLPFVAPKKYWDLYRRSDFRLPARETPPDGAPAFAPTTWGELRTYTDIPDTGPLDPGQKLELIHGYHAAVSYMDAQLGRVLDELDRLNLAANTIITCWGDHGWHLGDHGMWCKHTNYEQAARIPFLVCAPGQGGVAGQSTRALVESVDLFPTLCELAGLPLPAGLEGRSFAATLRNPAAPTKPVVFHCYPRTSAGQALIGRAVRDERHRLVEWKKPGAAATTAVLELYDYLEDPDETRNLAAERPTVVATLRAQLAAQPEAKVQIDEPRAPVELLANPGLEAPYAAITLSNASGVVSGQLPPGWSDNSLFAGTHTDTAYAEAKSGTVAGSALRVTTALQSGFTTGASFQIFQSLPVAAGRSYLARVRLKAAANTTVQFRVKQSASPFTVRSSINCAVTPTWQEFTFNFGATTTESLRLDVQSFNQTPNTVWIDELSFSLLDRGREWSVAPNGADGNPGSIDLPFRTLAAALAVVQPGDTLTLRAGTYRETLQPPRSGTAAAPIIIAAFPGETVTLTGCDVVATPWTPTADGTFTAAVGWDLGVGYNQVFVDGEMQHEARHPNHGSGDLLHPATADVTVSNTHTVTSTAFGALGDLAGARFLGGIGQAWAWQTAVIAAKNGGTLTLDPATETTWWWPNYAEKASDAGRGFVYGKLHLLDADGEWYLQTNAAGPHTLHLRVAGGASPSPRLVELKRRNWCIDLNNVSYVTLRGLRTRAGAIRLNGTGNTLENCDARFLSHYLTFRNGSSTNGGRSEGSGVLVDGTNNTVRGCTITDTAGSGIVASGRGHLLTRNRLSTIDYSGTYAAPIVLSGESHQITFNTVRDTGRDVLRPGAPGSTVMYNDLSGCGLLCRDLGVVYIWGANAQTADGTRTRVAYNWIHEGNPADPLSKGVYLDNGTRNFQVDHNVIWNFGTPGARTSGIRLNSPADGHELHHNTLYDCLTYNQDTYSNYPETNSDPTYWTAATHHLSYRAFNNLVLADAAAVLASPAQRDFRPKAGTAAVNPATATNPIRWSTPNGVTNVPANFKLSMPTKNQLFTYEEQAGQGVVLPGLNDGFGGGTPDSGAYEFDGAFWQPGVDGWEIERAMVQLASTTGIGETTATVRGTLLSAGLSPATVQVYWGTTDAGTNPAAWARQAALVGTFNGSFISVSQSVTGLAPGTTYAVRFRATNAAGETWSDAATFRTSGTTSIAPTTWLSNLSVRTTLVAGGTLISGLVVSGGAKPLLLRAAGPALATFGLTGTMLDPRLELYAGDRLVAGNDDWAPGLASAFAAVGAFGFPAGSKDAAFTQDLNGAHTLHAKGTAGGMLLLEAYTLAADGAARLANLSARNRVGTGADVLIVGFAVTGSGTKRVLIRAVGPTLSAFGVNGVLADPRLELFDSRNVKLQENNDWPASLGAQFAALGAFALNAGSRDAALLADLPPGTYTVVVSGVDGGTGEVLVEIYDAS